MSALASWNRPRPRAGARWQSSTGVGVPSQSTFQVRSVSLGRKIPSTPPPDSRSTLFGKGHGTNHFHSLRTAVWFECKDSVELLVFFGPRRYTPEQGLVLAPGCLPHCTPHATPPGTASRCPPGAGKQEVPLACWFPTMLAVGKHAGKKWLSPWVVFCAVACIGVGVGSGASVGADNIAEVRAADGSALFVDEGGLLEGARTQYRCDVVFFLCGVFSV